VGLWTAFDPELAWTKFWLIVGGVLLFYALTNAEPIGGVRVWLLAAFGAGVALYFLATHDWHANPAKFTALTTLGRTLQMPLPTLPGHRLNPNVAGGIMAMMVPFAGLATLWSARRILSQDGRFAGWLRLALAAGLLAVTCLGLSLAASRGAWLALAVALLLACLWAVTRWLSEFTVLNRVWLFLGVVALLLLVGFTMVLAWPGGPDAALAAIPGPDTAIPRLELLRNTLTLVGDYPVVGGGLGGFMMLHSTYALLLHVGFTTHSHNLFLSVAVELGGVALIILLLMWLLFAIALLRLGLETDDQPSLTTARGSLGAASLSLVVVLAHGLVDDALFGSGGVLLLFAPLAFAVPFLWAARGRARRLLTLALPVAVIAVLALALAWRGPVLSRFQSNLGAVLQSRAELSVYDWPEWPVQDAVRRQVDLSVPIALYERALESDPGNAAANRRLGQIELSLGEYEDALEHLIAAYRVRPHDVTTRQLLGEAYIANGNLEVGMDLLSEVDDSQGQLLIRQAWYRLIGREDLAQWMGQAARQ
jgi:hypothetical protein